MLRSVTALLVCCLTALPLLSTVRPPKPQTQIPAAFVRNVGQVAYTSGAAAAHVDAVFHTGNTTALIHRSGIHVVQQVPSQPVDGKTQSIEYDMYRMDMTLIGSNANARLDWLGEQKGITRFLTRPDDLPLGRVAQHYNQLYYHDVWPGIDLRLYIADGAMEYDFIVHPGAEPNQIAFYMHGAQEMGLTPTGGLLVSTELGTMSEGAPYTYTYEGVESKSHKIESRFVLDGRSVRFAVGEYDKTQTLVIDPRRVWATYFGYNQDAFYLNCAIDDLGNMLMSGATGATNLPEVTGVLATVDVVSGAYVEQGAVLAVARDMEMGVVVREGPDGAPQRTAVVERDLAQAMALQDWISCADPTARIARYHLTALGRSELRRLLTQGEDMRGLAEARAPFRAAGEDEDAPDAHLSHLRSTLGESPLAALARRRDKDGQAFLSRDLVAAGERLREDFELSQTGTGVTQNWDSFLTGSIDRSPTTSGLPGGNAKAARDRAGAALTDLGPGLADVVLRCCCFLEGLETLERRMGWSARSGKIVLRIALQRLKRHYSETGGKYGPMIG